jgi:arginyl-tRNA synthetase
MSSLIRLLSETVGRAFEAEGLDLALGRVTVSDRPDLAPFQCNGALAAAKAAKRNPREIAAIIAKRIEGEDTIARVDIAGPGFLNLTLDDAFLSAHVTALAKDDRLGVPVKDAETVIIDFGGPNIAKPMHVGHLRSSIIGDCLQRLFRFAGDRVIGDVHMGDWGTPMGMLISELEIRHPDMPYFNAGHEGPYPEESPVTLDDLERLYPEAAAACRDDEARMEAARRATAELQAGRPGYVALWRHFMAVSIAAMKREFSSLGVEFDLWKGEADVNDLIPEMVDDLKKRSIAEESEGALVVPVAREDDRAEMPPLIVLKSDGSVMYGTTDLATILDRQRSHDPDLILYVVDQRQHLHFEQVFRAAAKAGYAGKARLEHIGFGTVNGPDGKPFKTRAGGVMKLYDLIRMATDEALERLGEAGLAAGYEPAEKEEIARMVGLAAIKFADLSNHRLSNYIFDLGRFTSFEGKTGPYLQYAAVRIKSLLRKAADEGYLPGETITIAGDAERDLVLALAGLPDAIEQACERRAPNVLTDFAYSLAQNFSRFYAAHHILSEPDAALRDSRLALAAATLRQLELVLGLLGIDVPDRM